MHDLLLLRGRSHQIMLKSVPLLVKAALGQEKETHAKIKNLYDLRLRLREALKLGGKQKRVVFSPKGGRV